MKDRIHQQLCDVLNVTLDNLDIVSILHSPVQNNNQSLLDVRFSAHGSPYYWPEKLNTLVTLSQDKVTNIVVFTFVKSLLGFAI